MPFPIIIFTPSISTLPRFFEWVKLGTGTKGLSQPLAWGVQIREKGSKAAGGPKRVLIFSQTGQVTPLNY